ncbi:hypothetical protein [Candidatus Clostridium helianthi]|uniref:Uncharacterized protein n=1 Tax=Candidatus Clostridium helianthi TaxID=3381660 RepID=A0ABW8S157_9CLOT
MKKFISIFSIFLLLSFSINISAVIAQQKVYAQGIYTAKDLNLSPNISPKIQNVSQNATVTLVIFDSNQLMQQAIRLKPQSQQYALLPIEYDYTFVIVGNGTLVFS